MKIEQFVAYNLIGLAFVIFTHELGHFVMAKFLKYSPQVQINLLKFKFVIIVQDLYNVSHQKLIACSGCMCTLLCALLLRVLNIKENLMSFVLIYTIIFFLNLHPRFPDGKIFWQ